MIWRESFSICEIIYHLRFFKKLSWRWCKMLVSWSLSLHASWYGTSRTAVRRSIFLLQLLGHSSCSQLCQRVQRVQEQQWQESLRLSRGREECNGIDQSSGLCSSIFARITPNLNCRRRHLGRTGGKQRRTCCLEELQQLKDGQRGIVTWQYVGGCTAEYMIRRKKYHQVTARCNVHFCF